MGIREKGWGSSEGRKDGWVGAGQTAKRGRKRLRGTRKKLSGLRCQNMAPKSLIS